MVAAMDVTARATRHFAESRLVTTACEDRCDRLGQMIARLEPLQELGITRSPLAFFQRGLQVAAASGDADESVYYKEIAGCQPCRVEGGVAGLNWDELMQQRRKGQIAGHQLTGLKRTMNALDMRLKQRRLTAAIFGETIAEEVRDLAWNELTSIVRFIDIVTKFARI